MAAECNLYDGKKKKTVSEKTPFQFQQEPGSIYKFENEVFLKQVKSGDWSSNPSDYSDALKSLHLTLACDQALAGGVIKV